ncbi:thioredoxin domain-containing protein [Thiohalobacter sp. IOR34]|uniref:thioredoxin family protein n=1 Tax=Thiohalobacter sp. IOR34 TaxID=3057176 RepID=UPI0025B01530|nr:thioredoxin domain-containing protein [Thiohalobacter sp. IOR34]WJW76641.1 thioredoxin domain-containing protein [Thiohalobacter sp. IOR34]
MKAKGDTDRIYAVSVADFETRVLDVSHRQPVLVDFWAEWCSPCLVIAPVLERVIDGFGGSVLLAKVEVDEGENMKLAGRYRVRGFPTLILFEAGQEQARFSSARPQHYIREFIEQHSRLLSV